MEQIYRSKAQLAGGLILAAFWVLVLPLKWLAAAVIAAAVHEAFHFAAVQLCGGRVTAFGVAAGGAVMAAEDLSPAKQLICSLAGPIGGLVLLLAAKWIPLVAICSFVLSAYNLLPIFPLDGGRALCIALKIMFSPQTAKTVETVIRTAFLTLLTAAAVVLGYYFKLGVLALILPVSVIVKKNSLQTEAITSTIGLI